MANITTYNELVEEKKRLEELLKAQKQLLRADVEAIKAQLHPVKAAIDTLKKFTTRDRTNLLLTMGSDAVINLVVKNFLLKKTGWLTKLMVPLLVKNYASHVVNENKEKWFQKLFSWVGNKNGKHKAKEETENEEKPY